MSRDQQVVYIVCAGFFLWAGRHALIAAARAVRAWFRPEPLAPYSRYQDVEL